MARVVLEVPLAFVLCTILCGTPWSGSSKPDQANPGVAKVNLERNYLSSQFTQCVSIV